MSVRRLARAGGAFVRVLQPANTFRRRCRSLRRQWQSHAPTPRRRSARASAAPLACRMAAQYGGIEYGGLPVNYCVFFYCAAMCSSEDLVSETPTAGLDDVSIAAAPTRVDLSPPLSASRPLCRFEAGPLGCRGISEEDQQFSAGIASPSACCSPRIGDPNAGDSYRRRPPHRARP